MASRSDQTRKEIADLIKKADEHIRQAQEIQQRLRALLLKIARENRPAETQRKPPK